jgi:hypothetical protein
MSLEFCCSRAEWEVKIVEKHKQVMQTNITHIIYWYKQTNKQKDWRVEMKTGQSERQELNTPLWLHLATMDVSDVSKYGGRCA